MKECIGNIPEHESLVSLFQFIGDGVLILDKKGNIRSMNGMACDILGVGVDSIGRNVHSIIPERVLDLMKVGLPGESSMATPYNRKVFELRLDHSSLGMIELNCRRVIGPPEGFLVILRDVTDRWKGESALRESEEKYRATVEQSAENIYILDVRTNRIVESNRALQELLGYSAEELRGMEVSRFVAHPIDNISKQVGIVISRGRAIIGERTYRKKDGSPVDVEVSASHLTFGDKSLLCVVSRDITDRKKARERLIGERNRAELYLDLLAHDIGNLHHGMLSAFEIFKMVKGDRPREEKALTLVEGLLGRSVRLVDNILKLAQLSSEPVRAEPLDAIDLIGKAVASVKDSFPGRNVDIRVKDPIGKKMIMAEPIIEEAFFNVVHNAVKFQKGDLPEVEITLTEGQGGKVVISIADRGPGISPEDREGIFNRANGRSKSKGTGLGMSISKALIERSGGSVHIKDRTEGDHRHGTNVIIELPVVT